MGEWTPAGGLNISDKYAFSHGRPPNITLKVMSRIEHPFVMNTTAKDGNDRFEVRNCTSENALGYLIWEYPTLNWECPKSIN